MSTAPAGRSLPARALSSPGYVELVFALVFVWGFGDAVSTLVALALTGDVGLEANPLVRALLAHTPLLVVVMKGAVVTAVGLALLRWRDAVESVPLWRPWLLGVLAVGTLLVLSNLYVGVAAAL